VKVNESVHYYVLYDKDLISRIISEVLFMINTEALQL